MSRHNHGKDINKYTEEYKKNNSNITEKMTDKLIDAYIELEKKTTQYISLKKLDPFTTRGKNCVKFASKRGSGI